jgi:hypothetical protein
MVSPVIHRKWAREHLARAQDAPDRKHKLNFLRLAVSNSVRAQQLESKTTSEPLKRRPMHRETRRSRNGR